MSLAGLTNLGQVLQETRQIYPQISRYVDSLYNTLFPGGASPTAQQQQITIDSFAAMGTTAVALMAWYNNLCAEVLSFEAAGGAVASQIQMGGRGPNGQMAVAEITHPWVQASGQAGPPPGWTLAPDALGNIVASYKAS